MAGDADVAGVYRPSAGLFRSRRWRVVQVLVVLWFVVQAVVAFVHQRYGSVAYHLGLPLFAGLAIWLVRTQRTVVDAEGIRTKRGFRWRSLSWQDIESVPQPGRWSTTQMLSVTTTGGEQVPLFVPDSEWEAFTAYADAHRHGPCRDGVRERTDPPSEVD